MSHLECGTYEDCSNDDLRLTLTYFTSRLKLPNALEMGGKFKGHVIFGFQKKCFNETVMLSTQNKCLNC